MLKFSSIRIEGKKVVVTGPFRPDPPAEVVSLTFTLAQYPVMVTGQGRVQGTGWTGEAEVGSLQVGQAIAIGVAVLVDAEAQGMQTFTWCERKDVDG
jgi:hypothetical protein